jgi:hypothetical protein
MRVKVCPVCMDVDSMQFRAGDLLGSDNQSIKGNISPDPSVSESRFIPDETKSFVATNTNTITDYGTGDAVDQTLFRTSEYSVLGPTFYNKSMVRTTNSEMLNLLGSRFPEPFSTVIISAKLKVGSYGFGQEYTNLPVVNNTAYRIIKSYDPEAVSWNNFGSGGIPGTQYTTEGSVNGVRGDVYVEWDFTEMVSGWLSGSFGNYGIFFPEMGTTITTTISDRANVVWTILSRQEIS